MAGETKMLQFFAWWSIISGIVGAPLILSLCRSWAENPPHLSYIEKAVGCLVIMAPAVLIGAGILWFS